MKVLPTTQQGNQFLEKKKQTLSSLPVKTKSIWNGKNRCETNTVVTEIESHVGITYESLT